MLTNFYDLTQTNKKFIDVLLNQGYFPYPDFIHFTGNVNFRKMLIKCTIFILFKLSKWIRQNHDKINKS